MGQHINLSQIPSISDLIQTTVANRPRSSQTKRKTDCSLPDPDEGVEEFDIDRFDVIDGQILLEHLLVERHSKSTVNELPMVQRLHTQVHKPTSHNSNIQVAMTTVTVVK